MYVPLFAVISSLFPRIHYPYPHIPWGKLRILVFERLLQVLLVSNERLIENGDAMVQMDAFSNSFGWAKCVLLLQVEARGLQDIDDYQP